MEVDAGVAVFVAQPADVGCCCLVCGTGSLVLEAVSTVLLSLFCSTLNNGSQEVLGLCKGFPRLGVDCCNLRISLAGVFIT